MMNRRQFAQRAGLGGGLASRFAAAQTRTAAQAPPNILLILSDDHSAPFVGAYGNSTIRTPNLDRFASEGMRFDRMFTSAPQCVPSRASLMTGRSPSAARIARFNSPLPPDVPALPDLLRPRGYFTGICRRNFHLDGAPNAGPVSEEVFKKYGLRTFDKRVDYLDRSARPQTELRVNEFFDRVPRGRPFFLWVNFNDPHHAWDADAVSPPYDAAKIHVPRALPDLPGVRDDLSRYYGEVSRMDSEFQSVLDILDRRGHSRNTVVIFMGDNGCAFPRGKGSLYELGLNVPCIVRWPGQVLGGAATSELVSGEDLTPTLLQAAGLEGPAAMTGQSFLPLLRGQNYEGRKYIFGQRNHHGSAGFTETTRADIFDLSRCVRSRRHKLIYNCTPQMPYWPVDSGGGPGWQAIQAAQKAGTLPAEFSRALFRLPRPVFELYDMEADPAELENLAGRPETAAVQRELAVALQEKMIRDYDFLPLPLGNS